MDVKGTAFLARKAEIVGKFGEERWNRFIASLSGKANFVNDLVLPSTRIPIESFLTFQEELVKQFFNGDTRVYWELGEKSADWALKDGPYKNFIVSKDMEDFASRSLPAIWRTYFNEGSIESRTEGSTVHLRIKTPVYHIYFEYLVTAYFKRALELVSGKSVKAKKITGGAGSEEIYYQLAIGG
jgi:hypothetical protein